jgi:hypothetical protein
VEQKGVISRVSKGYMPASSLLTCRLPRLPVCICVRSALDDGLATMKGLIGMEIKNEMAPLRDEIEKMRHEAGKS